MLGNADDNQSVSGTYSEKMGMVTDRTDNKEYIEKVTSRLSARNSVAPIIKFDADKSNSIIKMDDSAIPHVDDSGFDDTFFQEKEKDKSMVWLISEKDT